ncbi:MAG: hypothetical protein JW993_17035 [Sedimentisphaerales bacterium]|nr:hypothetical protein [Sedimentisphaerales bacterium]
MRNVNHLVLFLVALGLVGGCVAQQPATSQVPEFSVEQEPVKEGVTQQPATSQVAESSVEQHPAEDEVAQRPAEEEGPSQAHGFEEETLPKETDAERAARQKQEAWTRLMQKLRKSWDEIEEVEWYHYLRTPMPGEKGNIHAYIGKKKDLVWLRFRMVYTGSDWLFVQSVVFKVDGETYELRYGLFDDWDRDHSAGTVWEWKDIPVNAYIWTLISKIADSERTIMRYRGQQYYSDRVVDEAEKYALRTILSAYEAMGGTQPSR